MLNIEILQFIYFSGRHVLFSRLSTFLTFLYFTFSLLFSYLIFHSFPGAYSWGEALRAAAQNLVQTKGGEVKLLTNLGCQNVRKISPGVKYSRYANISLFLSISPFSLHLSLFLSFTILSLILLSLLLFTILPLLCLYFSRPG